MGCVGVGVMRGGGVGGVGCVGVKVGVGVGVVERVAAGGGVGVRVGTIESGIVSHIIIVLKGQYLQQ